MEDKHSVWSSAGTPAPLITNPVPCP